MFNKKIRRELELFKQELRSKFFETVNCQRCGCMVSKELAIEGEKKIEKRVAEDVIVTHYYCKRCAPKKGGDSKMKGKGKATGKKMPKGKCK